MNITVRKVPPSVRRFVEELAAGMDWTLGKTGLYIVERMVAEIDGDPTFEHQSRWPREEVEKAERPIERLKGQNAGA